MGRERQELPSRTHHEEVSLARSTGTFLKTRLWLQFIVLLSFVGLFYVLFHHYLPTYRDLWYDLRPSEKELVFDSSDQMQFVDEKNGQFLIWYETYPNRYRFFNQPGFYGSGKERELADTDEKITMLKQWVDAHASTEKQNQDSLAQSQSVIQNLNGKVAHLEDANRVLQDKISSQEGDISTLVKRNQELTAELETPKQPATPSVPLVQSVATETPVVVENPDFYKHGAIIPPNPKPDAWFQSLVWGKLPPPPYHYNPGNGFFEIPEKPESRIAPHPHLLLKNKKTGLYERPYLFFVKIHGAPPSNLQIPRLDDAYYDTLERNFDAVFSFDYPYQVTLGGVPY